MPPQSNILMVEDDAAVAAALYEVLSHHDYRLITAESVQEAEQRRTWHWHASFDLAHDGQYDR